jgi:protein ImuB
MPLAEAKALLPRALYLPAEIDADCARLREMAIVAQHFTPLVGLEETTEPESLLADVTGCTHLWGGEEPFVKAVHGFWRHRGFQVQLALAGSVGAAWALAHSATSTVVPPEEEKKALAELPAWMLRLPPAPLERLIELGLNTIGDVLALPRDSLSSRFGVILPQRLDQALGLLPESFLCERLAEPLSASREWETPIEDRQVLEWQCRQLIHQVVVQAHALGVGIVELLGEIQAETGLVNVEIRLVGPTRDEAHLGQLAELQLQRLEWSGGVVAARWAAVRLGRIEELQQSWLDDRAEAQPSKALNALIERLSSRLEPTRVLRADLLADAQPEFAVRLLPWTDPAAPSRAPAFVLPPEEGRRRPSRILHRPLGIEVTAIAPDGPPVRLVWKRREYEVVRSWGPERIATGWWRDQDVERDYYRLERDDGAMVWVFRDLRDGRWYLHGYFE